MNLKDLKYFIAVVETENFTDAANRCYVTQPTLSAGIKKLEDELDVQLIVRGTKNTGGIRPTAQGFKILEIAKNIVVETDKIKKIAKQSKNPFLGDLRIGVFPTLCQHICVKVLPLSRKILTDMNFYLLEEKTDTLLELLSQDKVDIIFLATDIPLHKNIHHKLIKESLFFDPFYLAVSINHDYASKKTASLSDLDALDLLLLEDGHCLRNQVLDVCSVARQSNAFKADFRATNMETLLSMVRMGTGVTLVPQSLMLHQDELIHYIPFSDKKIGRGIDVVYNTQTLDKKVIEACQLFFATFK